MRNAAVFGHDDRPPDADERAHVADFAGRCGIELLGEVPFDDDVRRADRSGEAVLDTAPGAPVVAAVERLLDALERELGITAPAPA